MKKLEQLRQESKKIKDIETRHSEKNKRKNS